MGNALLVLMIPLKVFTVRISAELETVNSIFVIRDCVCISNFKYTQNIFEGKKIALFLFRIEG